MPIKKRATLLLIILTLSLTIVGCGSLFQSNISTDDTAGTSDISYTSYQKVNSQEEILDTLLNTMQNNQVKCYFCVSASDMIDADFWLSKLNGIETINCQYRRISDGYNVVVSLTYWDNYSIVSAYRSGNTSLLDSKQLELYNKYCEVLKAYTSPTADPWDNELAIHDYLVTHLQYIPSDNTTIYNAYDALINGSAVCNGYAECFKTFMDMLGIKCMAISGSAGNDLHIWNLVNLGDKWYQVDVTWDDPINGNGALEHTYFNVTDSDMAKDHTWDTAQYPLADGTTYSYPVIAGLPSFSNNDNLVSYLKNELENGKTDIKFVTTTTFDLKSLIAQCGIAVTYTYKVVEYSNYTLYEMNFNYSDVS